MCRTYLKLLVGAASLILLLLFSGTVSMADDIPYLINYQGKLTDSSGEPVPDNDYQITFTIWRDAASTNPADRVWISPDRTVSVTDGLFSCQLGLVESLPPWTFVNDSALWLGIQVMGDPEITPRIRMTSSPYAFKALQATGAGYADSALYSDTAEYARAGGSSGGWLDDGWAVRLENIGDYVGIGTNNPLQKLDVDGTVRMMGFLMPMGYASGYVLTSDENGEGTWQPAGGGDITAVNAGDGLTGGGTEGEVELDVEFAGNGTALTVSHSDHNHNAAYVNEGQADAVTGDMILHHSVDLNDIEQGTATNGQLMSWSTSYYSWMPVPAAGWAKSGNDVTLSSENDSVGIGTSNPSRKLDVRGDVYVQGNITWPAKTSFISISAAAFRPALETQTHGITGYGITGTGTFYAAVYLPQGADLIRITIYWSDANSSFDSHVDFFESHFNGYGTQRAVLYTNGSSGVTDSSYTESISGGYISNETGAYFLSFTAYASVTLYGVKIEYTFTEVN